MRQWRVRVTFVWLRRLPGVSGGGEQHCIHAICRAEEMLLHSNGKRVGRYAI